MKEITEAEMLQKMASYCSITERCFQDVSKKLDASTLSNEAKNRIKERLIQEKFIDEKRFSRAFVNDKLKFNQWGRVKIICELKRKSIPFSEINNVISEINEDEYLGILQSLLKSKNKTIKAKNSQERFYKLLRFAVGRGFTSQESISCLKKMLLSTLDIDYDENME